MELEKYKKSEALKELERLSDSAKRIKYPSLKEQFFVKSNYSDKSTNELTKAIKRYLELKGCYVQRVNTTGIYSQKLKKYIYSGSTNGAADLTAVVGGKHISIEIKLGRDKLSEKQKEVKAQVEKAGGIYIVVKNFQDLYDFINE